DADQVVDSRRQVVALVAAEGEDVDDDATLAVRHFQRGVADLARLLLEDRADQLLLGRQLGLALRRDLADQQVAGDNVGADSDDAALVEVAQALLAAVRDVAGDLLVAELGRAGVYLVLLDVDRGEFVFLDQALRQDDRVLEVVTLPGHEGDQAVLAQRDLTATGRRTIGEHVAFLHLLPALDDRALADDRALVRAPELVPRVLVLAFGMGDLDPGRVDVGDLAVVQGDDHVAGVDRGATLHPGPDQRGIRFEQRHGLALHVRAHQGAVGVVVLEERDQRGRHRPDLRRRHVHQVDFLRSRGRVLLLAGADEDLGALQFARLLVELGVRLGDDLVLLLGRVVADDLAGEDAVLDDAIRGGDKTVLGDLRVGRERSDQADVRSLRGLDRAQPAVVGRVHVADLDRGTLTGQTAGTERRQAATVGQPREA